MNNGFQGLAVFLAGVAVGAAAVYLIKDKSFRHVAAKVIGKGLQLKEEASALIESVKEDAEDIIAEARHNKGRRIGKNNA